MSRFARELMRLRRIDVTRRGLAIADGAFAIGTALNEGTVKKAASFAGEVL